MQSQIHDYSQTSKLPFRDTLTMNSIIAGSVELSSVETVRDGNSWCPKLRLRRSAESATVASPKLRSRIL